MRLIGTIEGEPIVELIDSINFKSKAAICVDGSGSAHEDPDYQNDTAFHQNGKALNADVERYVVVPPLIKRAAKRIVMGCQAYVLNLLNGQTSEAVVGDIGPRDKLGEISAALATAIGLDPSPTKGGIKKHVIWYSLIPGRHAVVNGKQYTLQKS